MAQVKNKNNGKILLDKQRFLSLEKKASVLDEIFSFIEDRAFGDLMQETEKEENVSIEEAQKIINK